MPLDPVPHVPAPMDAVDDGRSTAKRVASGSAALPLVSGLGLLAAATAFVSINGEAVVTTGFERAFAALGQPAARTAQRPYDGVAGTEDFWLRAGGASALLAAVAVGQEITLSANGTERKLTVTGVSDAADDTTTRIDTGAGRPVLVICREGDTKNGREVRLMLNHDRIVEVPASTRDAGARTL